ncbi:MAG: YdjY domain-containing protein [Planctomycetota bacterium]|jgi:hypothetical protein
MLRGISIAAALLTAVLSVSGGDAPGIKVDKDKKTITIDAKVAPRKLEHLKGEIYPLEVIATLPHPKGKKAHETIVTVEVAPSLVHKAIESLGLKAGAPVLGESKEPPQGPEFDVFLEIVGEDGEPKKVSIDKCMVDRKTGKAFPKTVKWRFTGSKMVQPDPNKKDLAYGADESGTLMVIFPVADATVMQTNLTMEFEKYMKLETNPKVLPKEGTPVKLILQSIGK